MSELINIFEGLLAIFVYGFLVVALSATLDLRVAEFSGITLLALSLIPATIGLSILWNIVMKRRSEERTFLRR